MNFRVALDIFRGPLDLLLYLVRKHELDVLDIPIALIADQYLEQLEVLEQLDVNAVGDFVEVASLLIEIKSRMVLPEVEPEGEESIQDPREELVERLLEYKKYKDAASMLDEKSHAWQQHYARLANDLPQRYVQPADQPIREVELWDLVSALGRILRQAEGVQPPCIVYDETPMHVHMQEIHDRLARDGRVSFSSMFRGGMHKTEMIGIFLAVLELVRNYSVIAEQSDLHTDIWLLPGLDFSSPLDISGIHTLELGEHEASLPIKPR
jgi:segregation and condensation protein A